MPGIVYDSTCIVTTASIIATGCATALTGAGLGAGRVVVTEGDVAWDLCDCGQIAVSVKRVFESSSVFVDKPIIRNCSGGYTVAAYEVSYVMCAPSPDVNGNPPAPAALLSYAIDLETAKYVVRNAVQCALSTMYRAVTNGVAEYHIFGIDPLGPLGGCGGFQFIVNVGWVTCYDC